MRQNNTHLAVAHTEIVTNRVENQTGKVTRGLHDPFGMTFALALLAVTAITLTLALTGAAQTAQAASNSATITVIEKRPNSEDVPTTPVREQAKTPTPGGVKNSSGSSEEEKQTTSESSAVNNRYSVTAAETASVCAGLKRGQDTLEDLVETVKQYPLATTLFAGSFQAAKEMDAGYTEMRADLQCSNPEGIPSPDDIALFKSCQNLATVEEKFEDVWPGELEKDKKAAAQRGLDRMQTDLNCTNVIPKK